MLSGLWARSPWWMPGIVIEGLGVTCQDREGQEY